MPEVIVVCSSYSETPLIAILAELENGKMQKLVSVYKTFKNLLSKTTRQNY